MAMIAKTIVHENGKWCVMSESGKNMGCSDTKEGAHKRLAEVEYFKHKALYDLVEQGAKLEDLIGLWRSDDGEIQVSMTETASPETKSAIAEYFGDGVGKSVV